MVTTSVQFDASVILLSKFNVDKNSITSIIVGTPATPVGSSRVTFPLHKVSVSLLLLA
jgi:hypothetical protein